jgi:hypothetical protein
MIWICIYIWFAYAGNNNEDRDHNHTGSSNDNDNDDNDEKNKEKISKIRESIHELFEKEKLDLQKQHLEDLEHRKEFYDEKKIEKKNENFHLNMLQTVSFIYSLRSHQNGINHDIHMYTYV